MLFLFSRQKLTTQLWSYCIRFWDNVYPFTMPGPQGELMTRENLISTEWHQRSPTYGHVTKLFLESEFQHKGNKQTKKNANSQPNLAFSSAATDSDHRIIQILHKKGQNNIWTELSSLGQEPTFKSNLVYMQYQSILV